MELSEKLLLALVTIGVLIALTAISLTLFMPHTFEGYYLSYGEIKASFKWMPDDRAFDYTPEMWQEIIENDLHLEPKK